MLFPTLSRFAARHDLDGLRRASGNGVRMIALFLIPAAVGDRRAAEPLTRLVYQRGEFGAGVDRRVTEALFWFSFSTAVLGRQPAAHAHVLLPSSARGSRPRSRA